MKRVPRMRLRHLRWPVSSILLAAGIVAAEAVVASPAGAEQSKGLADALAREGVPALAAAASGGDPARGAVLFHTAHLTCTKCHAAGGGVLPLGPDLAGPRIGPEGPLTGKALTEHLVTAVLDPSAWIGSEYRAATITTTEGQTVTGLVARETASSIVLRDTASAGGEIEIARDDVEERVDLQTSLMPAGLANLLADRQQFLDLVKYLDEIARGGPDRARALQPDPALLAAPGPAAYEADIDHAGFIADWTDAEQAAAAFKRGEAIYGRVCVNCHGTHTAPGSLPTSLRFAEGRFKAGADPHAIYRTLTTGAGQMVAQGWMVPSQKYDVIHYIREAYLKPHNPEFYSAVTPDYLAGLPKGGSRGPEPSQIEPWRIHDYGPFLAASIEVGGDGSNVARKGLAVRLDPGPGGIGRGHAWILYELDTLRAAAVWTGDAFTDWRGINFDGSHGTHPRVVGDLLATTPALPGWADPATGSFAEPRPLGRDGKPYGPLPPSHARFTALHHAGDAVVLEYRIGQPGTGERHGGTRVLETARLEPTATAPIPVPPIVTRIWSVTPHDRELAVCVAAVARENTETAVAIVGPPVPGIRLDVRDGFHVLVLPPSTAAVTVGVAVAAGAGGALEESVRRLAPVEPLDRLVGTPARNPWTTPAPLTTPVVRGAADGPFATDLLTPPFSNPWNAQLRLSGIDFLAADKAVVCTWDGDVWTVAGLGADTGSLTWKRIASGLYQPLGIKVIDGAIHVGCRDRIAILRDLDGDGCTDRYDTFNSDHQVTEHFHEFAMGLETDAAGTVYYAKSARHALPAVVPHHGTLLAVAKDGSATEILATGFRAANGVCVEPDGTFFVTDQEGHWNPKNRINHVRRGGFYGNMFGYHDVTDASDAAMEQPLAWLTNAFDRSPAELVRVPPTAWPQLSGRLLELSYGEGRIHLVLPQEVPGQRPDDLPRLQGGLVALPMPDFPTGIMRGRFHEGDQAFYTCGLFAWSGNKTAPGGLYRVRRTQAPLRIPVQLSATADGFTVSFASPLDRAKAGDPAAWRCRTWSLTRSAKYGSPHVGEQDRKITGVEMSSDGHTAVVRIEGFGPSQCYELAWDLAATDGAPVAGRIHGTVHVAAAAPAAGGAEIIVSPDGPIRSVAEAQQEARRTKANVVLRSGTYHLPEPLVFTAEDSGTEYRAAPGEKVVISGGRPLALKWEPFKDGIMRATTPPGESIDQLFIDGQPQTMARYPNTDPQATRPKRFGGGANHDPDAPKFNGCSKDSTAPERVARWADPSGGFVHALQAALWGSMHYRITGKKADGTLELEGGWQHNRPDKGPHEAFRFVENIFEELDTPGEWFHDAAANTLYFLPPENVDPNRATVEAVGLRHLVEFSGTRDRPVKSVVLRGITFTAAARTFMETKESLLRSDWAIYRGGAVLLHGAEGCVIEDCDFEHLGGNAIFVSGYNRDITVRGCLIRECGASGVAIVGESRAVRSPMFSWGPGNPWSGGKPQLELDEIDRTPGPLTDDYPARCLVEDCLITRIGRLEKQSACVQIAMAQDVTVRHCSMYEVPRAGINIGDGCWGGHVIECCDVFDTQLETGDHGSFNSWGRDRYWSGSQTLLKRINEAVPLGEFALADAVKPNILRNNRWRCDYGFDIDLDDGSTNYEIYDNLLLGRGLKLREGFRRVVKNNILVNNTLHPHCWYPDSRDVFTHNIVMRPYQPIHMQTDLWGREEDRAKWGAEIDRNLFTTTEADRTKFAAHGCDAHSVVGDPMFLDPARGDYRVRDGSPALAIGFQNFPMDRFGVRSPRLAAIARTPQLPALDPPLGNGSGPTTPAGSPRPVAAGK